MRFQLLLIFLVAVRSFSQSYSIAPTNSIPDSPVRLLSVHNTSEYLFDQVTVENTSQNTIAKVGIGAVLLPSAGNASLSKVVKTGTQSVRIHPGSRAEVKYVGIAPSELNQLADPDNRRGKFAITVGVIFVEFSDGTTWNYDLERIRRFPQGAMVYARKVNHLHEISDESFCGPGQLRLVPILWGGGYYSCVPAGANEPTYYSNSNSSCTGYICENPNNCAKQKCEYHLGNPHAGGGDN